jgi:hypothetical protein
LFIVAPPIYKGQNFEHKVKMVSNNGGIPDASMLRKDVLHVSLTPELSVEDMLSINSIQRRNYLSKHRSSDVQSAEYSASQNSTSREALKRNER